MTDVLKLLTLLHCFCVKSGVMLSSRWSPVFRPRRLLQFYLNSMLTLLNINLSDVFNLAYSVQSCVHKINVSR